MFDWTYWILLDLVQCMEPCREFGVGVQLFVNFFFNWGQFGQQLVYTWKRQCGEGCRIILTPILPPFSQGIWNPCQVFDFLHGFPFEVSNMEFSFKLCSIQPVPFEEIK